jgi:hypothetical protein
MNTSETAPPIQDPDNTAEAEAARAVELLDFGPSRV